MGKKAAGKKGKGKKAAGKKGKEKKSKEKKGKEKKDTGKKTAKADAASGLESKAPAASVQTGTDPLDPDFLAGRLFAKHAEGMASMGKGAFMKAIREAVEVVKQKDGPRSTAEADGGANDTFAAGTLFETYGKGKDHITRADFESMLRSDVSTAVERSGFKGGKQNFEQEQQSRQQEQQNQLVLHQQQKGALPAGATSNSTLAHMHALANEVDALEGELIALARVPGSLRFGARGIAHAHAMRVIENQIQVNAPPHTHTPILSLAKAHI